MEGEDSGDYRSTVEQAHSETKKITQGARAKMIDLEKQAAEFHRMADACQNAANVWRNLAEVFDDDEPGELSDQDVDGPKQVSSYRQGN